MTDDPELEARLRAHYRQLDPGPSPLAWTGRVEKALDRRGRPVERVHAVALIAAAVLVAVGVVGAGTLLGLQALVAGPSPAATTSASAGLIATPGLGSPEASPDATAAAGADLVGTFSAHGIWAIRGDQLLVSSDAGATWKLGSAPARPTVDGQGVRAATMVDATLGWVVTSGPGTTDFTGAANDVQTLVVHRTSDGGQSWRETALGGNFPGTGVSIAFADNLRGYILITPFRMSLTPATVFATDDGGATWHITGTDDTWALDSPLGDRFAVLGGSTLFAGANQEAGPNLHPLAAFSVDGGATWRVAKLPGLEGRPGGAMTYFAAPPTDNGMVGAAVVDTLPSGTTTHLYATNGQDWSEVGTIPQVAATGPIDLGNGHWLIATQNPTAVLVTIDAGRTWQTVKTTGLPSGPTISVMAGGAIDAGHAWLLVETSNAIDAAGDLMLSADGGRTWAPAAFGVAAAAATPDAPSPSPVAWPSSGDAGPSASAPPSTQTLQPGTGHVPPLSWGTLRVSQPPEGPSGTTQMVAWRGGYLALGNGIDAAGWLSADGRAWTPVPVGTFGKAASVEGVAFGDGLLVVGEDSSGVDTVWSSSDGATWRSMPMERVAFGGSQIASDGAIVVAVRNDGLPGVLASSDGRSWHAGATTDGSSFNPTSVVRVNWPQLSGFIAGGATTAGLPAAWTSEDGIHWQRATVKAGQSDHGVTLSSLAAGQTGIVATGFTGGTPGQATLWAGSMAGGELVIAKAGPGPLGVQQSGEGAGSVLGEFAGDGAWILAYGGPSAGTVAELWASKDGAHWTRVALTGSQPTGATAAYPMGDVVLFSSWSSAARDWLGTPAGG